MEDAIRAYTEGHADGAVGRPDPHRAGDPETGADYRMGLADGSLAAFESDLVEKIRRLMGEGS